MRTDLVDLVVYWPESSDLDWDHSLEFSFVTRRRHQKFKTWVSVAAQKGHQTLFFHKRSTKQECQSIFLDIKNNTKLTYVYLLPTC